MAFDTSFFIPQISENEIDFEKIEVQVLKVHIHCDGCKRKVKKIVRKIEGVFEVDIDKEQQKVTIKGTANMDDVINKLIKSGKHAEIWPENEDQNLSYNDWYSSLRRNENNPMMYPNLSLERENERVYSEFGIHDMMNPSDIHNNGQSYEGDADILRNMLPMINIKEHLNGENTGFDVSSFNHPSFSTINNMDGRTHNRKLPIRRNVNMNGEMPQYKQVTGSINNRYMQEMNDVSNHVIPQQMRYVDNMNQVMHQYTREMNNMNNHLMPPDMQEMDILNGGGMPRYIREMENMHGRVVPQYVQEMTNINNVIPRYMQEMTNMNNNAIPRYMQEMENINTHVMPQDMLETQYLMSYGSPFLPNYFTAPYPYRYNHNNFI